MAVFKGLKVVSKVPVEDKDSLAIVYTPGVAASCLEIVKDIEFSFDYTNRENSVGVFSFDYKKSLDRAIFLKSILNIDAYPFEIEFEAKERLKFIIENLEPTFCAVDLSLIAQESADVIFDVAIPVLREPVPDLKEFFLCVSKNLFHCDYDKFEGDLSQKSLDLRKKAGGVIEVELTEEEHIKPVAIVTDGSAVLGLGNIGSLSGLPVMEGKAVLFQVLGGVSAIPLCLKSQLPQDVIDTVKILENSFSAVNLEDICAPNCFVVEKALIESANIPIFHDDQHGTAIVILAGLMNALTLAGKNMQDVKVVMSGAGAAAIAVAKLLIFAGFKNIILTDKDGVVFSGRSQNNEAHEEISCVTNISNERGSLADVIKGADVFIGLSAPNILTEPMIKSMSDKSIVFALANPVPEILPQLAKKFGAYIVASGRSDFENQINNSLAFPGLFKGVLSNGVKKITNEIKLKSAIAIASLVTDEELNCSYIIPDALDFRVPQIVAENVR